LTKLLERKVADRLGSGPGGAQELKDSDFFGCLDFARVLEKGYTPEFKPPAAKEGAVDASNFDAEFTSEKVDIIRLQITDSVYMLCDANFLFLHRPLILLSLHI
jgi:hypothetical protein